MGLWGDGHGLADRRRLPDIPAERPAIERPRTHRPGAEPRPAQRQAADHRGRRAARVSRATALVPDVDLGAGAEQEDGELEGRARDRGPHPPVRSGAGAHRAGRGGAAPGSAGVLRAGRADSRDGPGGHDRVAGAQDRALYYRDILLPLRERIVNETQLHYNAMQLGVLQLLRDREQQIEAAVAYVEALRDYWLARTDLEQLLSGRVPSRMAATGRGSGPR